jgi:asparagine synthase (glutamine-hydrolysing)
MCGIAGFISRPGGLSPNSDIIKMTSLIHHRGPDDEGYVFIKSDSQTVSAGNINTPESVWKSKTDYRPMINLKSNFETYSKVAFGHTRLSILDLSPTGHQPMSYQDGRYWIVYNGEIYNYQDIRNELKEYGYDFRSRSDTEVVLAAYIHWGEKCLYKFVGMWSFAIYDKQKDFIFLARDRFGIKPFYYYFSSAKNFYFASEIKQFTVLSCWQARLNPNRVYDQLIYSWTDHTDETMFADVYQLPGGCSFTSEINDIKPDTNGKLRYKRWYQYHKDPYKGSFSEAAKVFKSLFERSVKEHLNADVPVGTALSGGLDSSAIVCEVNRLLKAQNSTSLQNTFSSCSYYPSFSEKKWMDIVINHTKVNANFVYPELNDAIELAPDILWYHDEPYQSQSSFLAYNVFNLANTRGVKVLLNGQGADEYLGGYGQFTIPRLATLTRHLKLLALLTEIRNYKTFSNQFSYQDILKNIVFHLMPEFIKRRVTNFKSSSDHVKRIIDFKKLGGEFQHPFNNIPVKYGSVPEVSEHLTFYSTLPKYLHWEDRNSMAHSVEARVPFLDHRLVEFAYNLPDDFLEKDGINKRIMREAMSGLLPEKIRNRKDKMGFTTPEEAWVKKERPDIFRAKMWISINVSNGIIKPEAIPYFDSIINGKQPFDYTYWRIILFGEWIQKFNIKI